MADTHIVLAPCRIYGVDYVGGERVDASTWPGSIRDLLMGERLVEEIPKAAPAPVGAAPPAPAAPAAAPKAEPTPPPATTADEPTPKPSRRRR